MLKTMKYRNIYMLLAALALFSCSKEKGGQEPQARGVLTMEASIGTPTKVAYDGDAASFAEGDKVSLYAWMGSATEVPEKKIVDGVVNTFDGTVWTPEKQMLWSHVKEDHYFLGVYPAKTIDNFTADAYTLGDDLMIATELDGIPFKENPDPVKLTFTHVLAKLNVNLKFRNQWDEVPAVNSVRISAKNHYTVNYLTKAVTATGDGTNLSLQSVTAVEGFDLSYSSLLVPQTGVYQVRININDEDYYYSIGSGNSFPLESGKVTTMTVYVGRDKIEAGSFTVTPWEENAPIQGGEALIPVTGISFQEGTGGSLDVDQKKQFNVVLTPEGATDVDCTWSSSDPSVATVSATGLVTALKPGTTTIRCTCSGKTAEYVLTVNGEDPEYTAPTAKTGLVYNGEAQALLNAGSVTTEGVTMEYSLSPAPWADWSTTVPTATDADTYKVYWRIPQTGKYNAVDNVETNHVTVIIDKATPTLSLSATAVSFADTDAVNATKKVTITYDGDGTLSAVSNNTAKVTASISGKTITLTRKDKAAGSVTVTVSADVGTNTNYNAPANQVITVTLVMIDEGTYLMNAGDGYRLGSNGKAYAPSATLPDGVSVVGAVIGSKRVVFKKEDESAAVTTVPTSSDTYGSVSVYIDNLTTPTSKDWKIGGYNNYESWGLAFTDKFEALNGYLETADCKPLLSDRHYGALQGWVYMPETPGWKNDYSSNGPVYLRAVFIF